jgi:hypothetical protein
MARIIRLLDVLLGFLIRRGEMSLGMPVPIIDILEWNDTLESRQNLDDHVSRLLCGPETQQVLSLSEAKDLA